MSPSVFDSRDGFLNSPLCLNEARGLLLFLLLGSLAITAFLTNGCDRDETIFRGTPGLTGFVKLEGQTEHSGVLLRVADLDSTTVTDSTGFFSFTEIPNGTWQLQVRYPYFAACTLEVRLRGGLLRTPVSVTLEQQLRFWIEPPETTIALTEPTPYPHHVVLDMTAFVENMCGKPVVTEASYEPPALIAVRAPEGVVSADCAKGYGSLISLPIPNWSTYTFQPDRIYRFKLYTGVPKSCFPPGSYHVYWAVSDQYNHAGWFLFDGPLNHSFYGKKELFGPASLVLVP